MAYSYNNENEFLKWYKANHNGKNFEGSTYERPEDMDDKTWAAVSHLYRAYLDSLNKDSEIESINKKYNESTNSILQRYSSAQNTLDENKRLAQQNASITYDKLKKYLPSQMKAQGLSGLGVSESAMLQADSHYMNSMGDIASNYSKDMTDLSNSKNETIAKLEKYKNDDLSEIDDKYAGYLRDASDKAFEAYSEGEKTELDNAYKAALTDIESRTDVDAAAMVEYITNTYGGKVRASDLELLIATGKSRVDNNKKIADEKAAGEKELAYTEVILPALTEFETNGEWDKALAYLEKNKDYFTNQSEYEAKRSYFNDRLTAQNKERAEESIIKGETSFRAPNDNKTYVIKNKVNAKDLGDDFTKQIKAAGFTSANDYRIQNGTTFTILYDKKYVQTAGKMELVPIEKTVTYYNGVWYESKKIESNQTATSPNLYNSNLYNYIK